MIISHTRKFIFLKTRKTGSSSIQMALSAVCGAEDIIVGDESSPANPNVDQNMHASFTRNTHANLSQIKLAIEKDQWASFYKCLFVRNPWDLVVSRYHWEKKGMDCSIEGFRKWVPLYTDEQLASPKRNAQSNIVERVWQQGGGYIFDLQSPFVFDGEKMSVDFVGRYENLAEDFNRLCQTLGIGDLSLPHLKAGYRKSYSFRDYYNKESKLLVAEVFAKDIEHFKYTF